MQPSSERNASLLRMVTGINLAKNIKIDGTQHMKLAAVNVMRNDKM